MGLALVVAAGSALLVVAVTAFAVDRRNRHYAGKHRAMW